MNNPCYLVLHKSEWIRMKRRRSPEKKLPNREAYFNSLNEQSQKWIKIWPDTVQGHVHQLEKQKVKERTQLLKTVKLLALQTKKDIKNESIKKARKMIFEDSCYGRQLLSALLESKTLEERDKQIMIKKQINDLQKLNDSKETSLPNLTVNKEKEKQLLLDKKQKYKEVALINKKMAENARKKQIEQKEKERNEFIQNQMWNKLLLQDEMTFKIARASQENNKIDDLLTYKKQLKISREKREEDDNHIREIYIKYQDKIKCKEKETFEKIRKEKYNKNQKIFEIVENLNHDKDKKYHDFIEKGIQRVTDKNSRKEKEEIENKMIERNKRKTLNRDNQTLAQIKTHLNVIENDKDVCYRQNIISKSCYKPLKSEDTNKSPFNKKQSLLEKLKECKKEPSPWSALGGAHAQFAQYANDTIRQCQYKHGVLKVINDYKKINCLDINLDSLSGENQG